MLVERQRKDLSLRGDLSLTCPRGEQVLKLSLKPFSKGLPEGAGRSGARGRYRSGSSGVRALARWGLVLGSPAASDGITNRPLSWVCAPWRGVGRPLPCRVSYRDAASVTFVICLSWAGVVKTKADELYHKYIRFR